MNNIDFTNPGGFPLDTNAIDFLQVTFASSINALTALGGDNFILSGCVTVGSNVSSGWVVINGELLPFQGGIAQTKVLIRETKQPVRFQDLILKDVYITRFVVFGTGVGEILFSTLKPVESLLAIKSDLTAIQDALALIVSVPTGVIVAWGGEYDAIPVGWHLCDGSSPGIPDLRNRFILGGGFRPVGRIGGVEQTVLTIDQIPPHYHQIELFENGAGSDVNYPAVTDNHTKSKSWGHTEDVGGGNWHDNMPPYYTLAYIIKL
jgi:microcystin-dependent protein